MVFFWGQKWEPKSRYFRFYSKLIDTLQTLYCWSWPLYYERRDWLLYTKKLGVRFLWNNRKFHLKNSSSHQTEPSIFLSMLYCQSEWLENWRVKVYEHKILNKTKDKLRLQCWFITRICNVHCSSITPLFYVWVCCVYIHIITKGCFYLMLSCFSF